VSLLGAKVGGVLDFTGARLTGGQHPIASSFACQRPPGGELECDDEVMTVALCADELTVTQDMTCSDGFRSEAEIRLLGARIGGVLTFSGASLRGHDGRALDGDALIVEGDMFMQKGFSSVGELRLNGARIDGQLGMESATLRNDAGPALSLHEAQVTSLWLRFASKPKGKVDLTNAAIGTIYDRHFADGEWPDMCLAGCTYNALEPKEPVTAQARIKWLRSGAETYAPQPYEQLIAAYRRAGHDDLAMRVAIAKQRHRREGQTRLGKLGSHALELTVGFGHRLWLAGLWILFLVAWGAVVFGHFLKDSMAPARSLEQVPPFEPTIYTLDLLIPVISLGQRTAWNPSGAAQWWALGFTVVGWLLTTAFIAGLAVRRQ
jgi:hypothetical protein